MGQEVPPWRGCHDGLGGGNPPGGLDECGGEGLKDDGLLRRNTIIGLGHLEWEELSWYLWRELLTGRLLGGLAWRIPTHLMQLSLH